MVIRTADRFTPTMRVNSDQLMSVSRCKFWQILGLPQKLINWYSKTAFNGQTRVNDDNVNSRRRCGRVKDGVAASWDCKHATV